jgi:hypothetical protein
MMISLIFRDPSYSGLAVRQAEAIAWAAASDCAPDKFCTRQA